MKKIISVLLCVIMAVAGMSLAACTPDGGDPNGGFETTGELIKDENGNIVYDDVIIRLTTVVTGEDKDTLQNLVGRFNREYKNKITVTMTGIGESTFEADVSRQLVNNNNPPHFIMSHQEGLKSLADVKLIQPLENIMNVSGIRFEMSDYANALSQYAYLGTDTLYSVPSDAQSVMVLYNKDVLKACGYDKLPENHDELVTLCTAAKNQNYTPIAWSTSFEQFQSYVFVTALLQNGAELYNPNGYRAEWVSNPQNKKAFENTMQSIRDLTNVSPADDTTANILNKFLNNEALFYVAAPWNMSSVLTAYINNNKDLGIESVDNLAEHIGGTSMANWFALDKTATYANVIYGDAHFFAMTKAVTDVTKKAAILEFIKWFTQNSSISATWGETGHISLYSSTIESAEYNANAYMKNYVTKFYPDINNFRCTGNTPYFKDLRTYLGQIIITALNKTNTLDDGSIMKYNQDKYNEQVDFSNM